MVLRRTIIAIACAAAALSAASSALASNAAFLHAGDVIRYGLTIDIDVHVAPAPNTTQPPIDVKSTVNGTETITGLRADPDGSVHAAVGIALNTTGANGASVVNNRLLMKLSPDGTVTGEGGENATALQYIKTISDAARLYHNRALYVGEKFDQSMSIPGAIPMTVTTHAEVVGEKNYLGYPTFAIQTTGNGGFDTTFQGALTKGTFDVAGTTYVDQRDSLLVGQAMRSNVDAQVGGEAGNHITAVTSVTLMLGSFTHAKPTPRPRPVPKPSPTPTAAPSPTPTPTLAPNQYYTPTPPAQTPPPVGSPAPTHAPR